MKKIILSLFVVMFSFSIFTCVEAKAKKAESKEEPISCKKEIQVHLFWREGCPHCANAKAYFASIEEKYGKCFELVLHQTGTKEVNDLFQKVAAHYKDDGKGVPFIAIGEEYFVGYSETLNQKLEKTIVDASNDDNYEDVVKKIENGELNTKDSSVSDTVVSILIIGVVLFGIVALVKTSKDK